jgi:RNA recognition motif-containing protein
MQNNFQIPNQPGRNVLYLSDLPTNVTESDIGMFLKDYKDNILVISILPARNTEFGKGFSAKVIFNDPQIANEARISTNLRKIKGKTIRVMWDELSSNLRNQSQSNIFVKNIPFDVKPREFYEMFLKFGDIISAKVPEDEEGNHLGYGYINYPDPTSAVFAIQSTDGKEMWGTKLDVKLFQKKSERFDTNGVGNSLNENLANGSNSKSFSLFLKNFPNNFNEEDVINMCSQYGAILNCKLVSDSLSRAYSIVSFSDEESFMNAKNSLQGKSFQDGSVLFVDILMNKIDRKKMLMNKIHNTNSRLNEQYKMCNLHIRNIPYHAKEEDLRDAFEKFGPIKSAKIETYLLITKVNNEYKQIPTSRGFAYVCYEDPECAKLAIEQMNLKFLPKYETWNRPLLVDYFQPKVERNSMVNKFNENSNNRGTQSANPMFNQEMVNPNFLLNFNQMNLNADFNARFNPMRNPNINTGYPNINMGYNSSNYGKKNFNNNRGNNFNAHYQQNINQGQNNQFVQNVITTPTTNTQNLIPNKKENVVVKKNDADELDYAYLKSLEDEATQRDYLGELIFKKIENHDLSQNHQFSIDTIGKITGMVLGIEDIAEIIDICKDNENLTARIKEGMELLGVHLFLN